IATPGSGGREEGCLRRLEVVRNGEPRSALVSAGQGQADSSVHVLHQHQQHRAARDGQSKLPQPSQTQQEPQGHEGQDDRDRSNPLELMDQQSHREKEFLQGLGRPPPPPSALTISRRSSVGGGRGGPANGGGLQGRLQAVLANLKVAFDREAEIAMSCRPQSPPSGSLLVEVCSRTREAHLTKAVCKVRQRYGDAAGDGSRGNIPAAGADRRVLSAPDAVAAMAAQPLLQPQPLVGQQVHVFLDSKRSDWGIEPGDNLLVLLPYKVLRLPMHGVQAPVPGPDARTLAAGSGGSGGLEGGVDEGGVGMALPYKSGADLGLPGSSGWDKRTAMETGCDGGSRGRGEAAFSGAGGSPEELVVLAHVTRRYGSAVS
ncbi:hypothetical protein Vafri_21761, partial [Volvox africanus]